MLHTRISTWALTVALALPLASALPGVPLGDRADQCKVHWQRKTFEPGAWPVEFPAEGRALVEEWAPWAREVGYRMDLTPDLRVLTLSSARFNRSVRHVERIVSKTTAVFDEWLPPVAATAEEGSGDVVADAPATSEPPVVLLRLHDRADYLTVLDYLSGRHEYLAPWTATAGELPGFVLRAPLCGAWIERDAGQEEWRPENEMVNRLANCLAYARFGETPHWLTQGVAWNVELEVAGSIHAFPGRSGFVGKSEHKGWAKPLKNEYARRGPVQLDMRDLASWERGTYHEESAGMAWGVVAFLVQHQPQALSPMMRDLGAYHATHGRITHPDGSWELIPDYSVPAAVQEHVFRRHAGASALVETVRFFQDGRRYKAPRPGR